MVELTEDGRALVAALLAAPVAWQSPAELARMTGFGPERTTDLLAVLDEGGWLSAWERPDDVVVTLSVAAASRLEVRLVETGLGRAPRWARRSDPEPSPPRALGVFRGERQASLELVVDPRLGPEQSAEKAEEESARVAASAGPRGPARTVCLPRPTILVGTGLSPWPGPGDGREGQCPACRSRQLDPNTYCLRCDRWGLDHLLRPAPPARPSSPRDASEGALRREQGRLNRREKRRDRRMSQAEAERRARRDRRGRAHT